MICNMERPKPKAVISTLEDIDCIGKGGVLEIHIMQLDGLFFRLPGGGKRYDFVIGVREQGSSQRSNGPFVSADELIEVYGFLTDYAKERGLSVVDSDTSYKYRLN